MAETSSTKVDGMPRRAQNLLDGRSFHIHDLIHHTSLYKDVTCGTSPTIPHHPLTHPPNAQPTLRQAKRTFPFPCPALYKVPRPSHTDQYREENA